jgi:prepilin-type N-terminal cleavage/methylation domain-containing protein
MSNHPTSIDTRANARARSGGFTLTELLVVVAIIVLLIGTLIVAVSAGAKRAQAANTQTLMSSIATGLGQFQTDFGYLPPVLGSRNPSPSASNLARDVVRLGQVGGASDIERQQNWVSYTTLAEYLIGYGHRGEDGYGNVIGGPTGSGNREAPPFGIRSPGSDGCWGAIDAPNPFYGAHPPAAVLGLAPARNPNRGTVSVAPTAPGNWNTQPFEGKVYGPYIELKDERLIAGVSGLQPNGRPNLVFADQGVANFDQLPKVIVDYWGEPIGYYRAPYTGTDLRSSIADANGNLANLGDIYMLRPWEIAPSDQSVGAADAGADDSSSTQLKSAAFALVSMGPDRSFDRSRRRDLGEFNKDNIVVTGK